jgi:hypothetical protein
MNPAILMLIMRVLLALLLYAFLAFLLIFLWQDLRTRSHVEEEVPDAHLLVVDGPDVGKTFRLAGENAIGRSAENDISLPDETVSAQHAKISLQDGVWLLEDLGSRNGTFVNQSAVEQPVAISSGDRIDVGQVRLALHFGLPEKN